MTARAWPPLLALALPLALGCGDGPTVPGTTAPRVTTASLPAAVEGVPYGPGTLEATGGDGSYAWSLPAGALPEGLVLVPTGQVSGTPTTAGTYAFVVRVTSGGVGATQPLTLLVQPPPELGRTPAEMAFFAVEGDDAPPPQELSIMNGGGGSIQWSVSADRAWVLLSDPAGTVSHDTAVVGVGIDPDGLSVGSYRAVVTTSGAPPADTMLATDVALFVTATALPVLGYSDPLPDTASQSANYLLGNAFVVTAATTLTHLAVIGTAAGSNVRLALYTDLGGEPDSLLVVTAPTPLLAGPLEVGVAPTALPPGVYWLMGVYDGGAAIGVDEDTNVLAKYVPLPFADAPPTRFPAAFTYDGQAFNYYVRVSDEQPPT